MADPSANAVRTFVKEDNKGKRVVHHVTDPGDAVRLAFDGWREETPAAPEPTAEPAGQPSAASEAKPEGEQAQPAAAPKAAKTETKQQG